MTTVFDNNGRPTFFYKDDFSKPIRACGILFYVEKFDGIEFVMIHSNNCYEDFGGKTEYSDSYPSITALRETEEESNYVFTRDMFKDRINSFNNSIYIKSSKYLLYICKLNDDEIFPSSSFGDEEHFEHIKRTVVYIKLKELISPHSINKIHIRLKKIITGLFCLF
jgi:hypothetical protein